MTCQNINLIFSFMPFCMQRSKNKNLFGNELSLSKKWSKRSSKMCGQDGPRDRSHSEWQQPGTVWSVTGEQRWGWEHPRCDPEGQQKYWCLLQWNCVDNKLSLGKNMTFIASKLVFSYTPTSPRNPHSGQLRIWKGNSRAWLKRHSLQSQGKSWFISLRLSREPLSYPL